MAGNLNSEYFGNGGKFEFWTFLNWLEICFSIFGIGGKFESWIFWNCRLKLYSQMFRKGGKFEFSNGWIWREFKLVYLFGKWTGCQNPYLSSLLITCDHSFLTFDASWRDFCWLIGQWWSQQLPNYLTNGYSLASYNHFCLQSTKSRKPFSLESFVWNVRCVAPNQNKWQPLVNPRAWA